MELSSRASRKRSQLSHRTPLKSAAGRTAALLSKIGRLPADFRLFCRALIAHGTEELALRHPRECATVVDHKFGCGRYDCLGERLGFCNDRPLELVPFVRGNSVSEQSSDHHDSKSAAVKVFRHRSCTFVGAHESGMTAVQAVHTIMMSQSSRTSTLIATS